MIFAIVLTPQAGRDNAETSMRLPAAILAVLVATMLGYAAIDTNWSISNRPGFEETAQAIGESLLDKYILPFEIAAALMLVAMLGAIIIVRAEGTEGVAEE